MLSIWTSLLKALENIVGIEENAGKPAFSPIPTIFSILTKTCFNFSFKFILSSAHAFCRLHMHFVVCSCILSSAHAFCRLHMHFVVCSCILSSAHAFCCLHMHFVVCSCILLSAHAFCRLHMLSMDQFKILSFSKELTLSSIFTHFNTMKKKP